MKLIDLLVKELPKRGGWPEGAEIAVQDSDSQICFSSHSDVYVNKEKTDWYGGDWGNGCWDNPFIDIIADDRHECIIGRKQYEAALAASDDWIEWHGGKCPVDSDAIVEVKRRWHNPHKYNNDRAGDFSWSHTGGRGDIIAYRLHDQDINARDSDDQLEQDLNECIGQDVVTEWDGEGLPPAGCECEARYRTDNAEWAFFRCVGIDCGVAFGWSGKEAVTLGIDNYEFRPLRTEAEKKRDAAIEKIKELLMFDYGDDPRVNDATFIYDAIAAGKIPGVKLEVK